MYIKDSDAFEHKVVYISVWIIFGGFGGEKKKRRNGELRLHNSILLILKS